MFYTGSLPDSSRHEGNPLSSKNGCYLYGVSFYIGEERKILDPVLLKGSGTRRRVDVCERLSVQTIGRVKPFLFTSMT